MTQDDFVPGIDSPFFEDLEVLNAYYDGESGNSISSFLIRSELIIDGSVVFSIENFDYLLIDFTKVDPKSSKLCNMLIILDRQCLYKDLWLIY